MSEYIHRDVEDTVFTEWYNLVTKYDFNKFALFVNGARQVGKTTAIKHFAEEHFNNVYYFNLKDDEDVVHVLDTAPYRTDYDVMHNIMQSITNNQFIDDDYSVIIFDEIQNLPKIYGHLRLFTRILKSQVIITGSYLGMLVHQAGFVPIGDTYSVYMTGLTFKEFLRVTGNNHLVDIIKSNLSTLMPFSYDEHQQLLDLFHLYLKTGGYPNVVINYLKNFDNNILSQLLDNIVDRFCNESMEYLEDVNDKAALKNVLYYIPRVILTRENITTKVSAATKLINKMDKNHNKIDTKTIRNVIIWLREAHMFTQTGRSISFEFDDMVGEGRIYLRDVGLASMLLGDSDTANGIITEGFVCTALEDIISTNHRDIPRPIAFIEELNLEIDFFIHSKYGKTAIEVKTGSNMSNKGSIKLLNEGKIDFIIRTGTSNLGQEGKILTVPLYAFPFLDIKKPPVKIPSLKEINDKYKTNVNRMDLF